MEPPRPRSRRRILFAAVSTLALALCVGLWKYQEEHDGSPQAAMESLPAVGDHDIERRGYAALPTPPAEPAPAEVAAPPPPAQPAEPVAAQQPIPPAPNPDQPPAQPVATPQEPKGVPARATAEPRPTRVRVAVRHSVKKPAVEPAVEPAAQTPSEKEDAPDWMVMAPRTPPAPDLPRGTNAAPILD
jgi:hypothetical protein